MLKILLALSALTINYFSHAQADLLMASPASSHDYRQVLGYAEDMTEDQPDEVILWLTGALQQIDEKKDPGAASRAYALMGDAFYYKNELDSAISSYQKAALINIRYGNNRTAGHVNILGNLGYLYNVKDQKLIALDYGEQALAIAREIGDTSEIAANLANLGQIKTLLGDYEEALEYMEEALALDRKKGDEPAIATDLNIIGRLYESWGMFDKAVSYLEQALEIDIRMQNREKMAIRYNSLGLTYKGWKKYDRALDYFFKALEIDLKSGKPQKVALRQSNIGSTYLEMNQTDTAMRYLEKSAAYFLENNLPSYSAQILNDLARCYFQKRDFENAEKIFLQSISISMEHGLNRFLMHSLEHLSNVYRETGKYQQSLELLHEYIIIKDSVFDAESQERMAEFHAKYELDKNQRENEMLRRDRELSKKRQIVMVLVFSLSALALVIIILALLFRMRGSRHKRLMAEKENDLLKSDLEQRSKELTYNAMCIIKNNETVAKIATTIEDAISSGEGRANLNKLVRQLQHMEREKNWTEFEVRFTQVHEDFYERLNQRFPDLTSNERKLCAFLRLNMSTKDIAAITHQSVNSINVARTRMRKKLGIDGTDQNLMGFLNAL